ncbi:MAG: replication initiation protein [Alphaproteobacteria bacterium]
MKINNKDVIQSYIMTTARYNFNVYEKRFIYRLIEATQGVIEGKKLNGNFVIDKTLFGDYRVKMPIKLLLNGEADKNHTRAKDALRLLNEKKFEYEDDEIWKIIRVIEKPILYKQKEYLECELQPEIFDAIYSFAKGFRKFELVSAMQFESTFSMRFYELFSGQKEPIRYSIENLKIMFNIADKYQNRPADFIRFVVDPAKKEMDKKAPYSFTYKTEKEGRKIVNIWFFPRPIPKNRHVESENKELIKKVDVKSLLNPMVVNYLKENYVFTNQEIKNNIDTFREANQRFDIMLELASLRAVAMKKSNPKGWLVGALKKKIQNDAAKNLGIKL